MLAFGTFTVAGVSGTTIYRYINKF
ncbi:hypothetical protein [Lactiplantibacillus plantarum]